VLSILGLALLGSLAYVFVSSMEPNDATKSASIRYFDVTALGPGELLQDQDVWIYHRTPEQVESLQAEWEYPDLPDWMPVDKVRELPEGTDRRLRSVTPNFFVFQTDLGPDGRIYLNEGRRMLFRCNDFSIFDETVSLGHDKESVGGFRCEATSDAKIIFDTAGRPNNKYFWPLRIPNHRLVRGEIAVYPRSLKPEEL